MLDARQIAAASGALRDQWRHGTKLTNLPPDIRPHDRTQRYAVQAELEKQSSAPLFGWKIAAASEAGQRHINVAGPDGRPYPGRDGDCRRRHRVGGSC
jgi:2-keto-4-pentenoate hydratase